MDYGSICGYTQDELERYFPEYIEIVASSNNMGKDELLKEIRRWYNGYSWDGKTTVYNPFSTLLFFRNREFNNYWFRTATPAFFDRYFEKAQSTGIGTGTCQNRIRCI
jgi:hypothetical protein